jgi:hypothetical protein
MTGAPDRAASTTVRPPASVFTTQPTAAILTCVKRAHRYLRFAFRYHAVRRGGWSSAVPPAHSPLADPAASALSQRPSHYRNGKFFFYESQVGRFAIATHVPSTTLDGDRPGSGPTR